MNAEQAKAIDIDDYLERQGHTPTRVTAKDKWYLAPYRTERTASFHTTQGRIFYDHGIGLGGKIITLAHFIQNAGQITSADLSSDDVSNALKQIAAVMGRDYTPPMPRPPAPPPEPAYTMLYARPMADRRGENWCRSRGLDVAACRPYLQDIYYRLTDKPNQSRPFYGVGVNNRNGGYEMRTPLHGGPFVKSNISPKGITVFEAQRPNAPWFLFEGLPDFCTFLSRRHPPRHDLNFLLLHGTGQTQAAMDYLSQQPPSVLYLCPQWGSQGSLQSCERIRSFIADQGWDGADIEYPKGFEDYNAFHMADKGILKGDAVKSVLKTTPKLGL